MGKILTSWLLLSGLVLSGAANADVTGNQSAGQAVSGLTPEIVYDFLAADIAAQRGIWPAAAPLYMKLAQQTASPEIARNALEAALYAHQPDLAQQAAGLWLTEQPSSLDALHAMIAMTLAGDKPLEALPYLKRAFAASGANPAIEFMRLGGMLGAQQDKQQGLVLVKALAERYPNLPEAHLAVAQADARAGQFDQALSELDSVDHLRSGWGLSAGLRFDVLAHISFDKANAFALDWLMHHPDADDVRLSYARWLMSQNRYKDAQTQFSKLAEQLPNNADMQMALGLVDLQLQDLDGAARALTRAGTLNYADQGLIDLYLGQIDENRQQYDQAAKYYRSVPYGAHYLQAQIRYAVVLAAQHQVDQAIQWLDGVKAENDADRVELVRAKGMLLRDAGKQQQAYDLLGQALVRNPDSADLLYDHAMLAEQLGHLDVVETDLHHLLALQPDNAQALNALGYTWADHAVHLDEANNLLQRALKLDPDDAFVIDSMGWLQYRKGNLAGAEQYISRAWDLSHDPEIAAHLGEVLWHEGKLDEVHALWKQALQAHPDNAVLRAATERFK